MDASAECPNSRTSAVRVQFGIRIPVRDGAHLSATLYLPRHEKPAPAIFTLTPYIAQTYHDRGVYFAEHGYPFLAVDVRGRGNSEGVFTPLINEAKDGCDIVEWLACQPYCDGHVAMWGGSYSGYAQWATAKELPSNLATIVPAAAPFAGIDFPGRSNIPGTYLMQWLTLVWGRTSQDRLFWNNHLYWNLKAREWFESGAAFSELDTLYGCPSEIFQRWLAHPHPDDFWDSHNPTAQQYSRLDLPILTITGIYDGDQPGALAHYREHVGNASPQARARHHLVIGPWDHAGTRTPTTEFSGLKVGAASLVDLPKLHCEWYAWTMQGGPKPAFLEKRVAYYVMGADKWRYADELDAVTARCDPYYLSSTCNPTDIFQAGALDSAGPGRGGPDHYRYDPRDIAVAQLESELNVDDLTDQRILYSSTGARLIYHTAPFAQEVEVSGFMRLSAWLAIDQADTDFRASVYEVRLDGTVVLLTSDSMRARYRESSRQPKLITTREPLLYEFERFAFVSRQIERGHRLRLVIGPINSIHSQKNYNSGGMVAAETMQDARTVCVTLFHDAAHPSALHVPFGQPET